MAVSLNITSKFSLLVSSNDKIFLEQIFGMTSQVYSHSMKLRSKQVPPSEFNNSIVGICRSINIPSSSRKVWYHCKDLLNHPLVLRNGPYELFLFSKYQNHSFM